VRGQLLLDDHPDHPDVAQSLNNLAELHRAQGEYVRALPLLAMTIGAFDQFIARQPGHVRRLANSPGYEMNFPDRGPLQQFYDEWGPWIVTSRVSLSNEGLRRHRACRGGCPI
jgi:hypothetical protein